MPSNTASTTCPVDDCPTHTGGRMCPKHRSRLRRTGTTDPSVHSHASLQERYLRHVVKTADGCWGWNAKRNNRGYGKLGAAYAHRVSWELHHGPIPAGMFVMHRCDNRICTNPAHLQLGTHADNMADAARKGRLNARPNRPTGEANPSSRLTAEQVRAIRLLRTAGVSRRAVAQQFGVSLNRISLITSGKAWRGVK